MLNVDRQQVLAYRIAAHGLHRDVTDPAKLAVLDLGVQDVVARDTASLALAARVPGVLTAEELTDDARFTLGWSLRGAPHYHRSADFPGLASALFPLDDADASARLTWQRADIEQAGMPGLEVIRTAARGLRKVVDRTMTKGTASEAVTKILPAGLSRWCRRCGATHIHDQLMRVATPLAGIRLVAGATPATLTPLEKRPRVPTATDLAAATGLVRSYLRLHGPATAADAASFLSTTRTHVTGRLWPDDLTEVRVDGRKAYLPSDRMAELENPPEPSAVRLLPPWDPFLQARDRATLVPDPAHRKELWKILGNPGALLAEGELVGAWRSKSTARRLELTITPLVPVPKPVRAQAEAEAERVAAVRGYAEMRVVWS